MNWDKNLKMTNNYIPNRGTNGVFFVPLRNIRWPVRNGDQKLKKNVERSYTQEWRLDIRMSETLIRA